VQNEVWLHNNLKKEGVKETSSGLQYKIIADPTPQDARPNATSTVYCDYTVKLINGYLVDGGNNRDLPLAQCIPGFVEGCRLIHNNGDIELYIPCYLGYDYDKFASNDEYNAEGNNATEGTSSYIPPYSTLIYSIHICGVSGD
jgi:FKBP-type peptidyl-prolyl cis-trans isomerases 1